MNRGAAVGLFLIVAAAHAAGPAVSYDRDVRPLLGRRCQMCHQGTAAAAGVDLSKFAGVKAASAKLVAAVSGNPPRMPKGLAPLEPAEIAMLERWVQQGARSDSSDERWWSLRPLAPLEGSRHSIDSFLGAKLKEAGLSPNPEADRRTLIRRVSLDLTGLMPTPAEVRSFETDPSPNAYARLVQRLLESPRYGERWARHWLDVAHYGDSHGYDKDKPRANAWPYRDWVIEAFNNDKPYARFIEDQIAGDALHPGDPQALIATGFLAAGPWDFVGHQELKEGTVDKNLTRVLDRDDIVSQVMSAFTSSTAHCARCHDHKFDPIPQKDYYRLQAVFAGVDRADRPFDRDPAAFARRRELLEQRRQAQLRIQPLADRIEFATSPEIVELDIRIQDAGLLIAHIGQPKTAAEADEKKMLSERRDRDRERRQKLVDEIVGAEAKANLDKLLAEAKAIDGAIAALPKPEFVYAPAAWFGRMGNFRPSIEPRPITVLGRGDVKNPGEAVEAGALSMLGVPFDNALSNQGEAGRRAALAKWISARENALTWRSIVNRVWHYHFGAGLVDTPNDFGRMGSQPSHPELLDWLAVWFRDEAKGSLKQLHRAIVMSAAYRQSSAERPDAARIDASNRLLWRMNRARLEAEAVRDNVLLAAGKLDLTAGGPAVRMFFFKDDHSPVYDYARFDPETPGANRRSIYRFIVRSVQDPFLERLDCPDPSLLTPKRNTTLTAIQALALLNNPFMVRIRPRRRGSRSRSSINARRRLTRYRRSRPTPPATDSKTWRGSSSIATSSFSRTDPMTPSRRDFLFQSGGGLGGIALASLLHGAPQSSAPAKSVIQIFLSGAASQCDTFDYKPLLESKAGEKWDPGEKVELFQSNPGVVMPSPWKWRQQGQCGKWVSDLLPGIGSCVDDIAFVHSLISKSNIHGPATFLQTTGFILPGFPSAGAWISYALGSMNKNLPDFVVLPDPRGVPPNGPANWGAGFLPAAHQGTPIRVGTPEPIQDLRAPKDSFITAEGDREGLALLEKLNRAHRQGREGDSRLDARIASYEMAARLQVSAPEVLEIAGESEATRKLYGIDDERTADMGRRCLIARRLVERGVRYVQLWSGADNGFPRRNWDSHENLAKDHGELGFSLDRPIAALLRDLKSRGLLSSTIVHWATEFGRMPCSQGSKGRDHNPFGFTTWLAGGGIRGGVSYGATDEWSYKAVDNPAYGYDIHATMLKLLGIDHTRLTYRNNGIDRRLTDVHGNVIPAIMA